MKVILHEQNTHQNVKLFEIGNNLAILDVAR
jgi:hypothetical protein